MKKLVFIKLFILVVCGVGLLVGLSYIEESAHENIEQDRPCETYQVLEWTSIFSKDSKALLARINSRGFCFAQNIPRAKELYVSVYGGDTERVARALFHDAIQLADFYERNQKDQKPEYIHALLAESKSLGFQPSERESKDLADRGLTEMFMGSTSHH